MDHTPLGRHNRKSLETLAENVYRLSKIPTLRCCFKDMVIICIVHPFDIGYALVHHVRLSCATYESLS